MHNGKWKAARWRLARVEDASWPSDPAAAPPLSALRRHCGPLLNYSWHPGSPCANQPAPQTTITTTTHPPPPVERVVDHLAVGGPCDLHTPVLQAHMGGAGRPRGTRWAGGEATGWAGAAPPAPALLHLPASSRARTAVRQSFPAPGHAHLQVGRQRRHLPVPLADLLGHRGAAGGQRRWGLDSCTAQAPAQLGHRGDSHGTATAQQRHSRGTAARTCWVSGRKLGWPPAS